jgi:hypothetical protein
MAFLVLLERVTPVERAVFLFREVFDLRLRRDRGRSWQERGELPADRGSGPAADRRRKPRLEASRRRREELAVRFFEAVGDGDAEGLIRMLAADAVAYADGGGKTRAFRPLHGRPDHADPAPVRNVAGATGRRDNAPGRGQRTAGRGVPGRRWAARLGPFARHRRGTRPDHPRRQQSGEALSPGPRPLVVAGRLIDARAPSPTPADGRVSTPEAEFSLRPVQDPRPSPATMKGVTPERLALS